METIQKRQSEQRQRLQVTPQSHSVYLFHLSDSHLMENCAPNLQIMYPLLQKGLTAREDDLFTSSILHFTSLLSVGATEMGAALTVVKLNVYLGLFLMDRICGLLTLPLEQTGN